MASLLIPLLAALIFFPHGRRALTPPSTSWLHGLESVHVDSRPVISSSSASPLSNLLTSYKFSLPESALRKGTAYVGSNHRLRRAVREAASKRPVKIGVIGGSITFGDKASEKGRTDWVSLLGAWAAQAFRSVTTRNGAVPGTPSSYMVMCMDHSLDTDVDIVFSEYLLNDGFEDRVARNEKTKAYEKLIRRVLSLPHKPAMVMLQMFRHGGAAEPTDPAWAPFHSTLEDVYGALAQYYDVQWLSFRTATNRLAMSKKVPGLTYADLMESTQNRNHPVDAGHKVMADLAVWLLQQTMVDLALRPWDHADVELMAEALPPPMIPGNEAPTAIMCVQGATFRRVVSSHEGWQFVNEGTDAKPKMGYVATTPGSVLRLALDTFRPGSTGLVVVSIGHLKSYEHMGKALVKCESGCTCPPRELDAHHTSKDSQTYMATLEVSQHRECSLSITVLQNTTSGEHKFKVTSVTVSETANPTRLPHYQDGYMPDAAIFHARNQDPKGFRQWLDLTGLLPQLGG